MWISIFPVLSSTRSVIININVRWLFFFINTTLRSYSACCLALPLPHPVPSRVHNFFLRFSRRNKRALSLAINHALMREELRKMQKGKGRGTRNMKRKKNSYSMNKWIYTKFKYKWIYSWIFINFSLTNEKIKFFNECGEYHEYHVRKKFLKIEELCPV